MLCVLERFNVLEDVQAARLSALAQNIQLLERLDLLREGPLQGLLVHQFDGDVYGGEFVLGEEHDAERAFSQLAEHLVLGQPVLLRETLCAKYQTVPKLQRSCVAKVHGSLLRRRAL